MDFEYPQEQTCRLCLSNEGNMELIFNSEDSSLLEKIKECTSLKIKDLNGWPKSVCECCKSKLIISYIFKKECIRIDELLKSRITRFSDENLTQSNSIVDSIDFQEHDGELEIKIDENDEFTEKELENVTDSSKEIDDIIEYKMEIDNNDEIEKITRKRSSTRKHSDRSKMKIKRNYEKPCKTRQKENAAVQTIKVVNGKKVTYHTMCQVCGKMQQNLKQHMLTHTGEKRHECPYCGKCFSQRGNFNHHLNIHTGNKPYKCSVCEKGFCDPNSLKSHMIQHTKERKYHCEICGHSFGYSHTLAAHRRTHTQDRKHSCEYCQKLFLTSYGLKKHIRIHTGEKPYQCEYCVKCFTSSGNLSTHRRVHTKEKPYKCEICAMNFAYKSVLNSHMKMHAKAVLPEFVNNSLIEHKNLE